MSGVTTQGFDLKTLEQILAALVERQKAALGLSFDTSSDSVAGQFNGTIASQLAEVWEAAQAAFNAYNPNAAEGVALDNLGALTGTVRRGPRPSEVVCTVNLDAGTILPAGSIAAVDGRPDIRVVLQADVENTGGVTANFTDTLWFTEDDGSIAITAGTLTEIVTVVSGWNSITNPGDAEIGRLQDSDPVYRLRREQALASQGGSTLRAIRAALIGIDEVDEARVYENTGDITDPETGITAHSIEALIDDGAVPSADDNEVAQTIFDTKPGGIKAYGSSSGEAIDEDDVSYTVAFSRVDHLPIYLEYTLVTNSKFPIDGEDQVKAAVVATAEATFGISDDIIALVLQFAPLNVAGVVNVTSVKLGFSASPSDEDDLEIGLRERGTFSTANITFT